MPTRDAAAFGALTLLLFFVAVNLQAGWVYALVALLAGFAAVGWITARTAVRPLPVERTMPAEVVEGESFTVTLRLGGGRLPRAFLVVADAVPGCDPGEAFIPILGRRGAVVAYRTTARRRGVHRTSTLTLRSEGASGLFRASRAVAAPGTITVLPRYAVLQSFPLPGRRGRAVTPVPRPSRTGTDVAGVREFRPGDDPSRVHWRSTARRGSLVVREFEREAMPAAALLLDTRPTGQPDAFEALVRAAASVAHLITRGGLPVTIVTARGSTPVAATVGWMDALRTLAAVHRDGALGPADLYAALPPGTAAVIFTPSADAVIGPAGAGLPITVVLGGENGGGAQVLRAMGTPVRVLRPGVEVGACLEA